MTLEILKEIVLQGENYKNEFKESLDKSFVEEVTAFANASGGTIFLGVSDVGEIIGVDTSNVSRSRVQDAIGQIKPSIIVDIEIVDKIIVIHVLEGKNKPYACSKGFFLRMGANSQKLDRDDILEFFQSEGRVRFDELLQKNIDFTDAFDNKAYEKFLKLAGISNVMNPEDVLINLDCGVKEDKFIFNNAGLLFFSKEPMMYIKQASVICALYKGIEKILILDRKDLNGNLIEIIEDGILFLKKHLNLRYEIKTTRREEILDIPETALREALINSICHRNYFEKGAQIMVEIFDDRVVISNPGGLPKGMDPKNFGKVSVTRNPIIASLLNRSDYIEKMGTGIQRMCNAMKLAGLPKPEFDMDGFFIVTLMRESFINQIGDNVGDNVGDSVGDSVGDKKIDLSEIQIGILKLLRENPKLSAGKLKTLIGISNRNIERNIVSLKELGMLKRIGPDFGGHWEVTDNRTTQVND